MFQQGRKILYIFSVLFFTLHLTACNDSDEKEATKPETSEKPVKRCAP